MKLDELLFTGRFDEFIREYTKIIPRDAEQCLYAKYLLYKGEFVSSLEVLEFLNTDDDSFFALDVLMCKAYSHWGMAAYQTAKSILEEVRTKLDAATFSETDRRVLERRYYRIMTIVTALQGNISQAIEYNKIGLRFADKNTLEDISEYIVMSTNLAIGYNRQSKYEEALEVLSEPLMLSSKLGNHPYIGHLHNALGLVKTSIGAIDEALNHFQTSIRIITPTGNVRELSRIYFNLTNLLITVGDVESAKLMQGILDNLHSSDEVPLITLRKKLARAIVLKNSLRLDQKFSAMPLLEEIVRNATIESYMKIIAMQHLTELLIMEIQSTDNKELIDEILDDIMEMIEGILSAAVAQSFVEIQIQTLILYSKLQMALGDMESSKNLMNSALKIAEVEGRKIFIDMVEKEYKNLDKLILEWQDTIDGNIEFADRLKQAEILDYLREVQKIVS